MGDRDIQEKLVELQDEVCIAPSSILFYSREIIYFLQFYPEYLIRSYSLPIKY